VDGTRFIKSFDDYRMSSMVETRRRLRAVRWHIDQTAPAAFSTRLPPDTYLVCAHISGHIDWQAREPPRRPAMPAAHAPDWRIRRTLDHIEETLHADNSLTDLAREVGLSTSQDLRIFKASLGCTPCAWVTRRRVERAAALLAASPKGITEIAAELNFSSSQQFATVFKRVMGVPPTVYRQGMLGRT
jgi:AraC-like DNA-binding protein